MKVRFVRGIGCAWVVPDFVSKYNSKGVHPGALPYSILLWRQLLWELAQNSGQDMEGNSLPSSNLGKEVGLGVLRAWHW